MAGHEVAPAAKPLESSPGEGAVPVGAPPPAPTTHAMPRTPAQTTKNETPKLQTQRAGFRIPVKLTMVAAVAACSVIEGCTGSNAQVHPGPPLAVTCPNGWEDSHTKFSIRRSAIVLQGYKGLVGLDWKTNRPRELASVKEGSVTGRVDFNGDVGTLPVGTLILGTWHL